LCVRSVRLKEEIPGFEPTLPQASGSPGIVALSRKIDEQTPEKLNRAGTRLEKNQAAIDRKFAEDFPESQASPIAPLKTTAKQTETALKVELNALKAEEEKLAATFRRTGNAETGEKLRKLRDVAKEKARIQKDARYTETYDEAVKVGAKDTMDDTYDFVQGIVKSDEAAFQGPEMPLIFRQVTNKYKPKKAEESGLILPDGVRTAEPKAVEAGFEEIHSLLKQVNQEIKASEQAGNFTKSYYLYKMRDHLDGKIARFEDPKYGDLADKLKEANRFWQEEYNTPFRKGVGGLMDRFNKYGKSTPDEKIVESIVLKSKEGVNQFKKIFGDDPAANELLTNGILDMFSRKTVRDGVVKPGLAKTFLRENKEALDQLPEVRGILEKAVKSNDLLLIRQSEVQVKQAALAKSSLSKLAKIENVDASIEKALSETQEQTALFGVSTINIDSPKQLLKSLNKLGISLDNTNVESLKKFEGHPMIDDLLKYRGFNKLITTYAEPLVESIHKKTGRLHTRFKQMVQTGRLSSSDPNMQNIPGKQKYRSPFIASEGKSLITVDQSSAELLIMGNMSGEPTFKEAFDNNLDLHTLNASRIYGVPYEKVTKGKGSQRDSSKAISFGLAYGISAVGLSRRLGISKKEAQQLMDKYYSANNVLKKWLDNNSKLAIKNGYSTTISGRKRFYSVPPIGDPDREKVSAAIGRQAMNAPIQGSDADTIKKAMVLCMDRLKNSQYKDTAKLVLTVHDEIIVECDYEDRYEVSKIVVGSVEDGFNEYFPDMPMKTDPVFGPTWLKGECEEDEEGNPCGGNEMELVPDDHYGTRLICCKCGKFQG